MSRETFNLGAPVAGFYKRRFVRNGPWVPVEIWYGPPADPETGELLDRSLRWQAVEGDDAISCGLEAWASSCSNPITPAEFDYMHAVRDWARHWSPAAPEANPRRSIDLESIPPLLGE